MNIVVCIKQVPDTASRIEVKNGKVVEEGLQWVTNPYDEYAVEAGLQLREKHGGKVTLVTVGPGRAKDALKAELARGADEAVHCIDPAFEGLDSYSVAQVLAAAVKKIGFDIVWGGWKGVDMDAGLTATYLAELLDVPHVSFVTRFELKDGHAVCEREIEGGREVVETSLPAVFTAQKGLNEPRYPSLKGIMAVKKKVIPEWKASDLGLDPSQLSHTTVELIEVVPPPERKAGRIITGTPEEAARELARLLRTEAKVI
jgi:electron transfer flavoprotein beta subunit